MDSLEPERNPLLNSLILPNIFKYCHLDDLRNFRAVCRLWYDNSKDAWCQKILLIVHQTLRPTQVLKDGGRTEDPCHSVMLPSEAPSGTVAVRRSEAELDRVPIGRYNKFVVQNWELAEIDTAFWDERGPWMRELYLKSCKFPDVSLFTRILLEKTPNLRELTIDEQVCPEESKSLCKRLIHPDSFTASDLPGIVTQEKLKSLTVSFSLRGDFLPVTWFEFLLHFPNLEKLVVNYDVMQKDFVKFQNMKDIFTAIKSIQLLDATRMRIQHLEVIGAELPEIFEFPMSALNLRPELILPLKTLKVGLGSSELRWLLCTFQGTLETLTVVTSPEEYPASQPLTSYPFTRSMSCLHTLEIIGNVTFDMTFLRFTPNLRRLCVTPIHRTQYYNERFLLPSFNLEGMYDELKELVVRSGGHNNARNVQLVNVVELEIGYLLEGSISVQLLKTWMPNVRVLSIPASPEIFTEICAQWGPTLRELKLLAPSWIDDQTVTGIMSNNVDTPCPPNITSCKRLKTFEMDHPHPDLDLKCTHQIPKLTEKSLLQGFCYLEELTTLKVYVNQKIGEACLRRLSNREKPLKTIMEIVSGCKCKANKSKQ